MTYVFLAIAALMIILALALILIPLMRRGRQAGRPRGVFMMALGLAFVMPIAAVGLYALVGTPAALNPVTHEPPKMTVDQAIGELRQRLAAQPDDVEGWVLLGQSYDVMNQPDKARDAYDHALKLAPDNVDVMVAWAQADSMARPDHHIEGKARDLLNKAVAADARNQRALWLLGISDYQAGQFVDASLIWRRLSALLQPGTKVGVAVQRQIAMADARAAGKSEAEAEAMLEASNPAAAASTGATAADGPALTVKVSVTPALLKKIKPEQMLFVFARAVDGPPMPLAVARLHASQLPATVRLTDGMGMTPTRSLSSADKVTLVARISASGQAIAQPGDLEGSTGPLDVDTRKPVDLVIDHAR